LALCVCLRVYVCVYLGLVLARSLVGHPGRCRV
jgi:hypothetical protein